MAKVFKYILIKKNICAKLVLQNRKGDYNMPRKDAFKNKDKVLEHIKRHVKTNGFPPSVREICAACDIKSTSTVHLYIEKLIEEGHLEKFATLPRALKIKNNDEDFSEKVKNVPILGKVAAGVPILAAENMEGSFPLPLELTGEGAEVFILSVKGDSMIEAGILSGDFLIVRHQNSANNGEIVVAMLEDEVTVKKFFKEKDYIRLQPENSSMAPIIISNSAHINIIGKVIGVIRKM